MREWWIEFVGSPNSDKHPMFRKVSGEKFESIGFGEEVIHVVEAKDFEKFTKKMVELERVINRIYFMGSGEKAYTSDFTTEVIGMIRSLECESTT